MECSFYNVLVPEYCAVIIHACNTRRHNMRIKPGILKGTKGSRCHFSFLTCFCLNMMHPKREIFIPYHYFKEVHRKSVITSELAYLNSQSMPSRR